MTLLTIGKDINGMPTSATPFSDTSWTIKLSGLANFTLPTNHPYYQVIITTTYDTDVFVACNKTAALPTTTLTNTGSVLITERLIKTVAKGDFLSFITGNANVNITVEYFGLNNI